MKQLFIHCKYTNKERILQYYYNKYNNSIIISKLCAPQINFEMASFFCIHQLIFVILRTLTNKCN